MGPAPAHRPDLPAAGGPACASCGAALHGGWCAACGQRTLQGRHTLRSFVRSGASQLLDLDRGFLHTITRLVVAPGTVIRGYLAGATVKYAHPITYLAVAFAAFALTGSLAGGSGGLADDDNRLLTATAVPLVALASRVLFWRARLNYAEHLVIVSYLLGTVLMAFSLLQLLSPIVPLKILPAFGLAVLAASTGYFTWSYARIFQRRPLLAAAGALVALAVGITLWGIAMMLFVSLMRSNS